jgi:ribosomal protein L12E/L44/L45/RPP1/RPP2
MKYLAAYALAWLSGKASPSTKDLEAIVTAAGGDFDKVKAETLIEALKDKSIHELISAGRGKLGGISLVSGGAPAASGSTAQAVETKDEKKDEKKEEEEDAALGGGMGLFGDDEEW